MIQGAFSVELAVQQEDVAVEVACGSTLANVKVSGTPATAEALAGSFDKAKDQLLERLADDIGRIDGIAVVQTDRIVVRLEEEATPAPADVALAPAGPTMAALVALAASIFILCLLGIAWIVYKDCLCWKR